MTKFVKWFWLLGSMALVLVSAGCFQQVSTDDNATPVSQFASNTPFPTETPLPPPTETPLPPPTEDFIGQEAAQPTEQTFPTAEPLVQQPVVSDALLTATAIVGQATQRVLDQTATAGAAFFTPFPTFTPTFDPLLQATQVPPVLPGTDCVHEVAVGENLYRISLRYGVLIEDIARASGITNINLIVVGQRLVIPGCGTTGAVPPPTTVPTAGADTTTTTAVPPTGSAGGIRHIVQQGETLFQISLRYGVPVNTIAAANGITNINVIVINQELIIP